MKHSSLAGKYAVVTGGSQGLGAATARLFAARGAAGVVLSGRDEQRGQAMVAELEAAGCRARFVAGDLQELASCRRVIAAADEAFGTLHVLVNVAAVTDRGTIWDTSPEGYERIMQVNARAPFFLIQDAVKLMQRDNVAGSIVNISSVVARGGPPFLTVYAMAKTALNVLTKNVAYAVMRSRIRVNALNVGWMDTPAEDAIQRRCHSDGGEWLQAAEAGHAVRAPAQAAGGGAGHRLPGFRRVGHDDRLRARLRPVGGRGRQSGGAAPVRGVAADPRHLLSVAPAWLMRASRG